MTKPKPSPLPPLDGFNRQGNRYRLTVNLKPELAQNIRDEADATGEKPATIGAERLARAKRWKKPAKKETT
jgi:hypothetical protein